MVFDAVITKKVLEYIKGKYGDTPEFLWLKSPKNAVFRHRENSKWYAAILNVSKQKLGINKNVDVDILDLKCDPSLVGGLRDGKNYFSAYHMNKEHWVTILLDESINLNEVFALIDLSYNLTSGSDISDLSDQT